MQNWKRLGAELMAESRYPESIKAFSTYLKDNPRDDEVLTSRGIAYASNNQFKKARSDFKLAIKINKDNAEAHNVLAVLYASQKKFRLSLRHSTKAIAINPAEGDYYFNRGITHTEMGQSQKAIKDLHKYLELNGVSESEAKTQVAELLNNR